MDENMTTFTVTDDKAAEWCIEKIKALRADTEKWTNHYTAQLENIRRTNAESEAYFTGLLAAYFDTVPHKVTKTQESYQLPSAKMVFKQQEPEYTRDDAAICDWLDAAGRDDLVQVKRVPKWADLKKTITILDDGTCADANGEIISGLTATPRAPEFKLQIKEDASNV